MERVKTLINKLQFQIENNENSQQLLASAQLLVAELSGIELPEQIGKVSIWMPSVYFSTSQTLVSSEIEAPTQNTEKVDKIETEIVQHNEIVTLIENETTTLHDAVEEKSMPIEYEEPNIEPINEITPIEDVDKIVHQLIIDATEEPKEIFNLALPEESEIEDFVPTLAFQSPLKEPIEVNDLLHSEPKDINEILREDKKEVAASLVDTPIKDLRKAIGINDKYRFINELFQGDENSYERSIKTINGFAVYPEAEHWIKRELHTKLCWVEGTDVVKQFDQLVRRRFLLI